MDDLLRLGDARLAQTRPTDHVGQCVVQTSGGREGNGHGEVTTVLDHGRERHTHRLDREVGEPRVHERLGQFDLPLTTDVVEDHVVAVLDAPKRAADTVHEHLRLHGLVVLAPAIGCLDGVTHGCGRG